MNTRKAMTKSLHTITAVARVAAFLKAHGGQRRSALELTADALAVLGYTYGTAELADTSDDTLRRCVAAVAEG